MTDALAATYETFGRRWAHGTSPLYEDWATGIAGDAGILAVLAALPPAMQQPNRIFAAARWAGSPLEPFPQWRKWLEANWARVAEIAASRTTQTNEPARCATLVPQLARIPGPLALLEVGTAAGLCLLPDRFAYEYTAPGGVHVLGDSPVVLPCRVDDDAAVPQRVPEVIWRRGIDLAPIDARDDTAVDWLATLVWPGPDHDGRVARLRAAAAMAAAEPPDIVRGDLLETLPDVAASAPADATLVIFHSAVLLYLDQDERHRFVELVHHVRAARDGRVVWISNESSGTLPGVDARVPEGLDTDRRFVQSVDGMPVALAGQHGATYEVRPFTAPATPARAL
ncbi:DUF2332 domain-containing protein [Microbacterium sp. zg.Y1090]|uniref:DUF2332 domain-containing protein n=1 Tax=Microbacterium TaxID=33882 RepID=UPI00214B2A15|nr:MULTISPECIES: DUF2332 domain-containing protein [unclassified Microbacterium]MCR2813527.1 DUF2332 domain-containing protein [Microbacterium sp. zg.Y1084]MCR2818136.1 DUF2332 domain-containing protein [Microbacterium sp. zg.Y1090]MDL5486658.1 DUF2332 domain-containing protein [Microbacterium sp. zg-Y1211]WIM27710.1 DUF2332 domain-containing protein [Microbacterium sp. zg-Y1090]